MGNNFGCGKADRKRASLAVSQFGMKRWTVEDEENQTDGKTDKIMGTRADGEMKEMDRCR